MLCAARRTEPADHGPVPAEAAGLSLFRFEGAAQRVDPGDVPPACPRAGLVRQAFRVEPLGSSRPGSLPARCAGGPLAPCVPRSGGVLAGRCLVQRWCPAQACAVLPLENSKASTSIFVLQATKSQRWMPWRLKPKKDVGDCEMPREAVYQASIRGCPNGVTQHLS